MDQHYLPDVVTLKIDQTACTGCERCIQVCPHAVFKMENKKAEIVDKDACMECGACMRNCAVAAISVRSGVGCVAAILGSKGNPEQAQCGCSDDGSSKGCC